MVLWLCLGLAVGLVVLTKPMLPKFFDDASAKKESMASIKKSGSTKESQDRPGDIQYSEAQLWFKIRNYSWRYKFGLRKLPSKVEPDFAAAQVYHVWTMLALTTLMWLLTKSS